MSKDRRSRKSSRKSRDAQARAEAVERAVARMNTTFSPAKAARLLELFGLDENV